MIWKCHIFSCWSSVRIFLCATFYYIRCLIWKTKPETCFLAKHYLEVRLPVSSAVFRWATSAKPSSYRNYKPDDALRVALINTTRYAVLVLDARLVGICLVDWLSLEFRKLKKTELWEQADRRPRFPFTHIPYIHHHGLDGDVCKETSKSQRWVNQAQELIFN